jgi:AraC family transcriptional regulator
MVTPEIVKTPGRKLLGMNIETSFGDDKTVELWSSFMPRRAEIKNKLSEDFISLQHYPADFDFQPLTPFTKWAVVEVKSFDSTPEGMQTLTLPEGMYATFTHKGKAHKFRETLEYIYGTWIPESKYELDDRPHFEVLGEKYKGPNDPNSEEDVWIPIKQKS